MPATLELVLYHDQAPTGAVEWSTTSDSGPWTQAQLPSPLPLREALEAWAALVTTASGHPVEFTWAADTGVTLYGAESAAIWIRLSDTLAELLGFSDAIYFLEDGSGVSSDLTPHGIAQMPIGRTHPREVEQSEVSEYRGGRVTAYHWGRAGEVTLDLIIPPELWDELEEQAIVSGYGAIKVTWDNEDPYSEDDLDGYYLVFPTDAVVEPRDAGEETVIVHVTGTLLDPGTTAAAGQNTAWAKLWRAVPYGYSAHYLMPVEGITSMFVEFVGDAIAPDGYTLDPSLVVDRSSRIGPVVIGNSNIGAAYDLDARLLDTATVRALMVRPASITRLRSDSSVVDNALLVDSTEGFEVGDIVYFGTSAEEITEKVYRFLGIGTRGAYGRIRSYKKGLEVASGPLRWENRRATLHVALRDPCGRYVQGDDVLSDAVMVGAFYLQERPTRAGLEWAVGCRDQVRRLAQPLGVAASGIAVADPDPFVSVDQNTTFAFHLSFDLDGPIEAHTVRPFVGVTGYRRHSALQALVAAAYEAAAVTSGLVNGFAWRVERGLRTLFCSVDVTTSEDRVVWASDVFDVAQNFLGSGGSRATAGATATEQVSTGLVALTTEQLVGRSLMVRVDKGTPSQLPTSGWILIEASGRALHKRYTGLQVDDSDPSVVSLVLDESTPLLPGEAEGEDVSVKFFWRDSGRVYDMLRRAIVSTGDAQHGTYDTLPRGQGLGLPDIDAASFVNVFDVFFRDLQFDVGSEAGTSLEQLFGGLLRLSQRALTSRRSADGKRVEIAAVRVGSVDSLPVVRIDDAALVGGGPKPVRVLHVFTAPQAVEVKCRTLPVGDQPSSDASIAITVSDVDSVVTSWELDIYGVPRSAILPAAKSWGRALGRANDTRQVIEILLPAWYDVQGGDVVDLDLVDPHLWDYAPGTSGEPGYSGLARALGSPLMLTDGIQALTVMCDGLLGPGPMSPALPVSAVNGTATSPTSIDVNDSFYDILVKAKDGQATWTVLAYLPGQDSGRAEYTITDVTLPGGGVARLAVSASPSSPTVTLTADHFLTWPVSSECTDDQERYLHADQRVQWG